MKGSRIYVEGGGSSEELQILCREGFRKLLENAGFRGRMPRFYACGTRNDAYNDFHTAHASGKYDFVGLLVDSEDPVENIEQPWAHLTKRDKWERPAGASDEQVFLMVTSMETWIVADRAALKTHFGTKLQEKALPALVELETKHRDNTRKELVHATRNCTAAYSKDELSFKLLAAINPSVIAPLLPSFARMLRILNEKL